MSRYVYFVFFFYLSIIGFLDSKKYKVKLISSTKCTDSNEKMDLTTASFDTSVKKIDKHTTVIVTNFTVLRLAGPITISLKANRLKGASKTEIFKLDKVDCNNPVTYQLVRVVNMKINDDCKVVPGNYLTENINLQDFSWILTKAMVQPGKYEYILQFFSEKGLAVCNTILSDIQELH